MSSAAIILHKALENAAFFGTEAGFDGFVGFFPDQPHKALCVFDVDPRDDGRLMRTGRRVQHPGILVQVRALEYQEGYKKAHSIALFFDRWRNATVTIGTGPTAENHQIQNISRLGGVNSLGVDTEKDRRHYFTVAAFLTYYSVLPLTVDSLVSVDEAEITVDDTTYRESP